MYRHSEKQLKFVEFHLPFGGQLLASNRWVRLSQMIPWHECEEQYCRNLTNDGKGPPALSVRMALAALIIKERLGITDEECVEQIRENPYLQYFCGMKAFSTDRPFHPTMLVHFRKRFPADVLKSMNESILARAVEATVSIGPETTSGTAKSITSGSLVPDWEGPRKKPLKTPPACERRQFKQGSMNWTESRLKGSSGRESDVSA